ncbi:hypothetical protein F5Y14DRAFT_67407 [Nemania sp. NC0429]|nr:hypothetical protein F5Y14DRAFT_67407 [Nemania sp. NC0429]
MSPITEEKTSRAQPIIAGFNGFVSDGQASQSNTSRKGASLRPVSDREGAGVDGVEAEPPFQKRTGRPEIQILPYVIHDGGAYQLPISLQSELQKTLRGALKFKNPERELAQRLALLSPNQIRTLQDILRYKSEEQIRKLVQLKVLKTSKLKFWQRGTQVMIAFVEGDVSSMPESILSTTDDTLSSRYGYPGPVQVQNSASDLEHVLPSVLNSSKGVNGILNSRTKQPSPESEMSATSPLPHLFHRNVINQIPSIVPNQNQPNSSGGTRLPGFQDVTAFLVNNEEWRKRLTEYRVWTIVPYLDSYLTRMPSHSWDRCLLSEDFLSVTDIKRRLSTLDKNSMTVLEKMSTLDVSQQIQVMRSVEEARTDGHEAASEWNIRQLEIIRTRRLFKPKNVKAIIVYVYRIPSSQAFRGPEDPQGPRPGSEINHGGGQNLEPQNPTKRRQRVSTDYDSNTSYDDNMTRRSSFDRLGNDEDRVKRIERLKREEIERQNYAIASRRPVPSVPTTSVGPSSLYGASRPATRSISPRPVIRGQSRSSSRYSDRAGYVGTFTSDNGFSSRGDPEYSDESYWARGTDYKGGDLPVQQRRMGEAETTEWFPRRRIAEQEYYPEESGRSTRNSYYGPASSMGRRNSYSTVSTHRNSSMATPRRKPYLLTYPRGDPTEDERYPSEFDREPYDLQLSQQEIEAYDKPIKQLLLDWTPQNDGDDDNISDPPSNEESQVDDTAGTLTANESSLGSRDKQPHYTTPTTTKQPEIQLDGSTMGHMIGSRVEPAHLQPHQLSPHPMLAGQSQIQADRSSQSPSPTLILEPSQAPSSLEEKRAAETEIGAEAAEAVLKGARKESDASITESAHWAREELSGRTPAKQEHLPNLQRRTTNENNRLHGETNQRSSSSDANTEDGHDAGDQTPRVEDWRGTDWARHIVEETAITAEPDEYESHTPRPGTRQTVDRELSPREREYESEFRRGRRRRDSERSRRPSSSHRIRDETRERYYRGSSERLPSQPVRRRTVEIEEPREGQYRGSAERLPPPNPPRRRTVEFEEPGDRQSPPSQRRGKGA